MSTVAITPEILTASEPYVEKHGVYWFNYDGLSVRELAKACGEAWLHTEGGGTS